MYKNENGAVYTTIYRKWSDRSNFLHYKSAHPKACKTSIPYSQSLHLKWTCPKKSEVVNPLKDLKDAFIKRGYQSKILDHYFERVTNEDRKILLENKEEPSTQGNLPLVLALSKALPNIKNVTDKYGHIFSINENLQKFFLKKPFIACRRNININISTN